MKATLLLPGTLVTGLSHVQLELWRSPRGDGFVSGHMFSGTVALVLALDREDPHVVFLLLFSSSVPVAGWTNAGFLRALMGDNELRPWDGP